MKYLPNIFHYDPKTLGTFLTIIIIIASWPECRFEFPSNPSLRFEVAIFEDTKGELCRAIVICGTVNVGLCGPHDMTYF